jgi:hypothetical protein
MLRIVLSRSGACPPVWRWPTRTAAPHCSSASFFLRELVYALMRQPQETLGDLLDILAHTNPSDAPGSRLPRRREDYVYLTPFPRSPARRTTRAAASSP